MFRGEVEGQLDANSHFGRVVCYTQESDEPMTRAFCAAYDLFRAMSMGRWVEQTQSALDPL